MKLYIEDMKGQFRKSLFIIVFVLSGCASASSQRFFKISREKFADRISRILLIPTSISADVRNINNAPYIFDREIEKKLQQAGYEIISSNVWIEAFDRFEKEAVGMYDPLTGERDNVKYLEVRNKTIEELQGIYMFDAVMVPEIVVVKAPWSGSYGMAAAFWDGVQEQIVDVPDSEKFLNEESSYGYVNALSLKVTVYNYELESVIFENRGGIQSLAKFTGKRLVPVAVGKLLSNELLNKSAINIAIGPVLQVKRAKLWKEKNRRIRN